MNAWLDGTADWDILSPRKLLLCNSNQTFCKRVGFFPFTYFVLTLKTAKLRLRSSRRNQTSYVCEKVKLNSHHVIKK